MEIVEIVGALLVIVAAITALYFGIARLLANRPAYPAEIEAFGREHNRLVEDLRIERAAAKQLSTEAGRLAARVEALERELAEKMRLHRATEDRLHAEIDQLQKNLRVTTESLSQAVARLEHSERANAEMKLFLAEAQERLSGLFTEMASKVFDERSREVELNLRSTTERSRADIETLLQPYAERLGEFRKRLDVVHGEETQERASLMQAVSELRASNVNVAQQALALTDVLRGRSKMRGDWGDLVLDSVLHSSGLVEGQHYRRGKAGGDAGHPDVLLSLPDDRRIVIDCSLDLASWQQAVNAAGKAGQEEGLRLHVKALQDHVAQIAKQNYPSRTGADTLEVVIAFVPIEGALSAALEHDPALQAKAFEHKVALASPNTLIALLAVVERLWTRDLVRRQAAEISAAGGKVLEALTPLLTVFEHAGQQLGLAHESFAQAQRLLIESSQSLIPHAQRLSALGKEGGQPKQA